jgi:hypothetical protein
MADRSWREEANAYVEGAAACLVKWLSENPRRVDDLEDFEVQVIWAGGKRKALEAIEGQLTGIRRKEREQHKRTRKVQPYPSHVISDDRLSGI